MALIRREDAIEEIESAMETSESIILIAGLACAKGILTSLPSAEADWIPCSERLPSESDYYLVTNINAFEEKEVCVIWFAHKTDYGVSEWREITDEDTILAWMPLPKPYREGDEV